MEAPKCRACGLRHWKPPCPNQDKAESAVVKVQPKKVEAAPIPAAPPPSLPHRVEPKADGGFDRVRYQREYMRLYRARARTDREQTTIK